MKIAIAGGLGFEKSLLSKLQSHNLITVGSGYDLTTEEFIFPEYGVYYGEYLTHNYHALLQSIDVYIELSENEKSKHILNEFWYQTANAKMFVLYFSEGWKTAFFVNKTSCYHCIKPYSKPLPPVEVPKPPSDKFIELVSQNLTASVTENQLFDYSSETFQPVSQNSACPVHQNQLKHFHGEWADVVSVSCGENSVSISPMNELILDLAEYQSMLQKHCQINRKTPFFLEFKVEQFTVMLFRQGRIVVKGTQNKNTAMAIYRNYIGS